MRYGDIWIRHDGHPHTIVSVEKEILPYDERLLRSELLTILGIMITRLRLPSFREHTVVPVSFSNATVPETAF